MTKAKGEGRKQTPTTSRSNAVLTRTDGSQNGVCDNA